MMYCEFCNAEMSAGDISVFPESDGKLKYKVICPNCDKSQSSKVVEENGVFYVISEERSEN